MVDYATEMEMPKLINSEIDIEDLLESTIQGPETSYLQSLQKSLPETDFAALKFDCSSLEGGWERAENKIGQGFYGTVYKAKLRDANTLVAIKKAKDRDSGDLTDELKVMAFVGKHPGIVQILGASYSDEREFKVNMLVLEFCPFGSLLKHLIRVRLNARAVDPKYVDVSRLINYSYQIAGGLAYLSAKKIAHRDIAARNILMSDLNRVKIADFGLARSTDYMSQGAVHLPIFWMPPEILSEPTFKFDAKSDVWSFGVLLWELFTLGQTPYDRAQDFQQIVIRLDKRLWRAQLATPIIHKIMIHCWDKCPSNRPSFSSLEMKFREELHCNRNAGIKPSPNLHFSISSSDPSRGNETGSALLQRSANSEGINLQQERKWSLLKKFSSEAALLGTNVTGTTVESHLVLPGRMKRQRTACSNMKICWLGGCSLGLLLLLGICAGLLVLLLKPDSSSDEEGDPFAIECSDQPPPPQYTCEQQKNWGKCDKSWMKGFCEVTCGKCSGGGTTGGQLVCSDQAPDHQYSCQQQEKWGKCKEPWMTGFCQHTCGTCPNT